jgi:hypothetical protein
MEYDPISLREVSRGSLAPADEAVAQNDGVQRLHRYLLVIRAF